MFRRAFWFTAGAVAGVWAATRVQRTVRGLAPDALAVRAAGRAREAGQRLRDFALDVRAGMAQREEELHEALGLTATPPGHHAPAALPAPRTDTARRRRALPAAGPVGDHTARRTTVDHRTTGTTGKEDH